MNVADNDARSSEMRKAKGPGRGRLRVYEMSPEFILDLVTEGLHRCDYTIDGGPPPDARAVRVGYGYLLGQRDVFWFVCEHESFELVEQNEPIPRQVVTVHVHSRGGEPWLATARP